MRLPAGLHMIWPFACPKAGGTFRKGASPNRLACAAGSQGSAADHGSSRRHRVAALTRAVAGAAHRAWQAVGHAILAAVLCAAVEYPILWWGWPTDTIRSRTLSLIYGPADHPEGMRAPRRDEIAEPNPATPPGSGSGRYNPSQIADRKVQCAPHRGPSNAHQPCPRGRIIAFAAQCMVHRAPHGGHLTSNPPA